MVETKLFLDAVLMSFISEYAVQMNLKHFCNKSKRFPGRILPESCSICFLVVTDLSTHLGVTQWLINYGKVAISTLVMVGLMASQLFNVFIRKQRNLLNSTGTGYKECRE